MFSAIYAECHYAECLGTIIYGELHGRNSADKNVCFKLHLHCQKYRTASMVKTSATVAYLALAHWALCHPIGSLLFNEGNQLPVSAARWQHCSKICFAIFI
jgi:hypothetical protein